METNQQQHDREGARAGALSEGPTVGARSGELPDYQDLLDLTLEVGVMADKLVALQNRLTQKLCELAERRGFEADEVWGRARGA